MSNALASASELIPATGVRDTIRSVKRAVANNLIGFPPSVKAVRFDELLQLFLAQRQIDVSMEIKQRGTGTNLIAL